MPQINGFTAEKISGRSLPKLTENGYYWKICYENGLRMFAGRRKKEYLARQYANRCINPPAPWGGSSSKELWGND